MNSGLKFLVIRNEVTFTHKLDTVGHFFIISLIVTKVAEDTLHFYISFLIEKYINA